MSYVQQQIIDLAPKMSDESANVVVKIMNAFLVVEEENRKSTISEKRQAYLSLKKMVGGFPADFDPEKEIAEAREDKYGTVD